MGSNWKETTLGEFAPFNYGKGLPKRKRNPEGGIPVYGSNGITGYHNEALIEKGIIIGRKGSIGEVEYSEKPFWPIDTTFYVEESPERDIRFTYYLLKSLPLQEMNSDSAVPGLNRNAAHSLKIKVPDLNEQKRIAHILGTLDDKIELNQRMNETLEAIARTVFKSWFVDFDPVKAKIGGEPYPLPDAVMAFFPDEMVESELGMIPKGWEGSAIRNIAANRTEVVHPAEVDEHTLYIGLEHMPRRCIALDSWENAKNVSSNKYLFAIGNILFGKLRPYFHKVGISPINGICSTDILVINGKESVYQHFLLFLLSSKVFIDNVSAASTGTKMPRTNWNYMESIEFPLPNKIILDKFDNLVRPMIDKILINIHGSQSLLELRDILLSNLISKEIGV